MDAGKIVLIVYCSIVLLFIARVLIGWRLATKTTDLIFTYNIKNWLEGPHPLDADLDYNTAERHIVYILLCPRVVSVRQCLTKEAWEKVKDLKGREKEIQAAAKIKHQNLVEEIAEGEKKIREIEARIKELSNGD